MSDNVKHFRCCTRMLIETCNFEWSIERFRSVLQLEYNLETQVNLDSATFRTGKSSITKWCIRLQREKYNKYNINEKIKISLIGISSDLLCKHFVDSELSIIGSNNEKKMSNECHSTYYLPVRNTTENSLEIETTKLYHSSFVPDDTLTVRCELKVSSTEDLISELTEETETPAPVLREGDYLRRDFKNLYENKMLADITLKVGEEDLKAHKIILCSRSSVFNSMLNCDMKENITNCVEITDFDPPVVKIMLQFIYCGQVSDLTPEISFQLYSIADKYNLQDLKNLCVEYLSRNIDIGNICDVLVLGEMHNETELITAAKNMFSMNAAAIQETKKWLDLSKTKPDLAMDMYRLAISHSSSSAK